MRGHSSHRAVERGPTCSGWLTQKPGPWVLGDGAEPLPSEKEGIKTAAWGTWAAVTERCWARCKAFGGGNPKLLRFLQKPFSLFIQTLVTSFSCSTPQTLKTFHVCSP